MSDIGFDEEEFEEEEPEEGSVAAGVLGGPAPSTTTGGTPSTAAGDQVALVPVGAAEVEEVGDGDAICGCFGGAFDRLWRFFFGA